MKSAGVCQKHVMQKAGIAPDLLLYLSLHISRAWGKRHYTSTRTSSLEAWAPPWCRVFSAATVTALL